MTDKPQEREVARNYEAFTKILPGILQEYAGKFALMHDGEIVDYFDTAVDAFKAGHLRYGSSVFSIQEVTDNVVDLGYFSHVIGV